MTRMLFTAAIVSLAIVGTAHAQTTGTATTDLNIRSGPGPEQPVIGLIKARQQARILGCIEGSLWCQVDFRGQIGWSYSQYMSLASGSGTIVVREPAQIAGVPVITYNPPPAVAVAPTYQPEYIPPPPPPAMAPIPTVVGRGGAGAGAIGTDPMNTIVPITPPALVGAYVTSNVLPSVPYPGEIVIGATVPQTIVLNNVPDYRYQYTYVNNTPVLVDPVTRQIVYVFR